MKAKEGRAAVACAIAILLVLPACQAGVPSGLLKPTPVPNMSVSEELWTLLKQGPAINESFLHPTVTVPKITPPTVTIPRRTLPPTAVPTGPGTPGPLPTPQETTIPLPSPAVTPGANGSVAGPPVGEMVPVDEGYGMGLALAIGLLVGGGAGIIALLRDSIRHPGQGRRGWWEPNRRVFAAFYAVLAICFSAGLLASALPLLLPAMRGTSDPVFLLISLPLMGFAALSSLGMAISSSRGQLDVRVVLLHILVCTVGALLSLAVIREPWRSLPLSIAVVPFATGIAAGAFQAREKRSVAYSQGGEVPDTLLFEDDDGAPVPTLPPALGQRYIAARFLHQGGIAQVYSACRRSDGTRVAVKVPIRTDEQTGKSFLREMNVWKGLDHPGIVRIYAANILPVPFVEMEYLPGSLADIPVPVSPGKSLEIVRKIAEAIRYAHEKGVIHRDLKPENILLGRDGEPKVGDWGLAREGEENVHSTLHGFSLSHAAPEQLDPARFGKTTVRTDIYQLGIIWYWLVTGRLPFPGRSIAEALRERLEEEFLPPSSHVPGAEPLDSIIQKCLAREPGDRYRDMRDLLHDIGKAEEAFFGDGYDTAVK
ncbi:MAG: serine/threonine protein kinase [Methanolinea sp.]|nr:serine/threonine protein kinase [Methanolinea sp.]